jgi:hypothetical protein
MRCGGQNSDGVRTESLQRLKVRPVCFVTLLLYPYGGAWCFEQDGNVGVWRVIVDLDHLVAIPGCQWGIRRTGHNGHSTGWQVVNSSNHVAEVVQHDDKAN